MKKILILIGMVIILLISSCTPNAAPETTATIPPTNTPSKTTTVSPTVTKTPIPTGTSEPTLTPSSAAIHENLLSENGPWFMYRYEDESIYFVNQDGTGKTQAPFSTYLAFITSSTNNNLLAKIDIDKSGDRITSFLNIYKLPDFELLQTIDLQSYLIDHQMEEDAIDEIQTGTGSMLWSPNGRYLAFPAAIDGLSTDLYVYDTLTDQVNRLTSGENHVGNIFWSPNSQWIVHEEVIAFHGWYVEAMWAAAADGTHVKWLYQPDHRDHQQLLGWLGSYRFVTYGSSANGLQSARITNLYSNESILLYPGAFGAAGPVLAPDLEIIAFNTAGDGTLSFEENGLYMIDLNAPALRLISYDDQIAIYDESNGYFMTYSPCLDEENGFSSNLGFTADGILTCVPPQPFSYYQDIPSPDGKWTLDFEYEKVSLINTQEGTLFTERGVDYQPYWRSDSAGFFLASNEKLLYFDISTQELIEIDNALGFTNDPMQYEKPAWIGE